MSVLSKLACSLGRADEQANVALAEALVKKRDASAIKELASALTGGTKAVQNDAIKVLYEVGSRKPELVASHVSTFLALLKSGNNRNVWGALQALESIAELRAKDLARHLPDILYAADKGSVIAKDKAIAILVKLSASGFAKDALPLLLARLKDAAPNQFPMYAEQAASVITPAHSSTFKTILNARLAKIVQPAKRKRIEKVLKALGAAR